MYMIDAGLAVEKDIYIYLLLHRKWELLLYPYYLMYIFTIGANDCCITLSTESEEEANPKIL